MVAKSYDNNNLYHDQTFANDTADEQHGSEDVLNALLNAV